MAANRWQEHVDVGVLRKCLLLSAVVAGCVGGTASAQCVVNGGAGPDLIVGEIAGLNSYGNSVGVYALAFGLTYCNVGSAGVLSSASTNQHMVEAEAMFKFDASGPYTKFEQLGQSWAFHEFFSLSASLCCPDCSQTDGSSLGVHCSNAHSASIIGTQNRLGPKWQVNASTGVNVFPPANPTITNTAARRLHVKPADLQPTSTAVRFVAEVLSIAADDATANNSENNASRREVVVTGIPTDWNFGLSGTTTIAEPAIKAWKANDPDVTETVVDVPEDGRFIVSSKATNVGGRRWHYEYAVYNMTSDRSCGGFILSVPPLTPARNLGFHDVDYHDGDGSGNVNFSGTDWAPFRMGEWLIWSTQDFASNPGANAIRWGTLYNFRFECDLPPMAGIVGLSLYKPAAGTVMAADAVVPSRTCSIDFNWDRVIDFFDYLDFVNAFATGSASADFNWDGVVDFFDYLDFVESFASGC